MNNVIRLKKGLDIRIEGVADGSLRTPAFVCEDYAIKPTDFWEMRPKLLVQEGDRVKAGSPLFYDKNKASVRIVSPVSGLIEKIVYGPKRQIEEIRIKADAQIEYESFESYTAEEMSKWKGEQRDLVQNQLINAGLWPFIRQRPYNTVADPESTPRDIFISGFDTSPLAPDMDMIIHGHEEEFQSGLDVLRTLTLGKVHLSVHAQKTNSSAFLESKRVEIHEFEGPHPCGNISVQVHHIAPINKGESIWYVSPQDVIIIGRLFLRGKYDATRIIALAGSEVIKTGYYKVLAGIHVKYILQGNIKTPDYMDDISSDEDRLRVISGNILTGQKVGLNGYIGAYDSLISVIPEGKRYRFMGWMTLGFNMFSFSRTFFSWIFRQRQYGADTNMNGGPRAFVLTGEFEKVFPMDIYPLQLIKACIAKDIDEMEKLGIYEVAPEDFALCEYIDASKTNIQQIVQEALELMHQEMSE